MKKRFCTFFIIIMLCCAFIQKGYAQETVNGVITSISENTQLSGVTVTVKGTPVKSLSDNNGKFSIKVSIGQTITITSVGFKTKEVLIDNYNPIQIALEEDYSRLNDVVVVGYGTSRKKDLSGSVVTVSGEDIKSLPITSFEQGLQGRVAGVQVMQGNSAPGGAPQVRIRGANTVLGGNEPLYIIDGVPVYNSDLLNNNDLNVGTQPSNALASINPNDIVSMEVLKDASATAIYGARGANGVVIITTKRGKASDRGKIVFESYFATQQIANKLDLMNSRDYVKAANEKAQNVGTALPYPNVDSAVAINTDWQDVLFRTAPMSNYSLSFSGGSPKSQYNISGNLFDQDGVIINTNFKRYSVRINLDNQINDKIKVATSFTAARSVNNRSLNYILSTAMSTLPTLTPYDANGNFRNTTQNGFDNPLESMLKTSDRLGVNRILGNVKMDYKLLKELTYSLRVGLDYTRQVNDIYVQKGSFTYPFEGATVRQTEGNNYLIEHILNYNHSFNKKHRINATTGYTWQKDVSRFFQQSGTGFQFNFGTDNLGAASVTNPNQSSKSEFTIISYLGRFNYVYDDKYIVTFTSRADGSSRFGPNNKWGFFPSGAVAWRVSKEKFMNNIEFVNDLKLRASYGLTGNQEIGSYNSVSRLSSVSTVFGNPLVSTIGYVPTSLANADLKWEINKQLDIGMDVSFWDNRITLNADYYQKRTEDLLANLPIPGSSGFSTILINSGSILNKGFELGITGNIIDKKELSWSVNANISRNNTKVLKLANETGEFFAQNIPSPVDRPVNIIKEGEVLSAFWGYKEDGLDANGDIKYQDLNKDGVVNGNDQTILGSPFPDVIYGLNSNLKYKGFYLTVFLQGVSGVKVFNSNDFMIANSLTRTSNQLTEVNDRWTTANPNPNAKYPRLSNKQLLVSDRFIQDADYLRLKNIVVGYDLPVSKFNLKWLEAARVYVSGQNILTFTDYHGYDPEVSQTGSNSLVKGLDRGSYPSNRIITVGFNVTFK